MTVDWPKVAGRMRADLDRAALNERPRMVLALLIKVTLMKRRTMVVLPDREVVCGVSGCWPQHMKGIWKEIEDARIATFKAVELGWEVVLQPDSSQWACDWVCTREQLDQWVQRIEQMPGQAQGSLLPPDPNLRKALGDNGAQNVSNQKCYSNPPAVTKSVTANPPQRRDSVPSTVISSAVLTVSNKADKTAELLSRAREARTENELLEVLTTVLAQSPVETDRQDMASWGAHWRVRHIRPDLERFAGVMRSVAADLHEGIEARKSRVAWIKDLLKR